MKIKTILLFMILSLSIQAQKTYVKITKDNTTTYYPPGTSFELKNQHGYIILKYSETPRVEEIKNNSQIILSPNYKKGEDIINLKKGDQVELALTKDWGKIQRNVKEIYINPDEVVAHKKITDSQKYLGQKNLNFELSNGIEFIYKDGDYRATYGKESLDIRGKYVIQSKIGTLKISFNPESGELWWIFEKKQ